MPSPPRIPITSTYYYDALGRISGVGHANESDTFDEMTFAWDAETNKTSRTDVTHEVSQTFSYDSAHRMKQARAGKPQGFVEPDQPLKDRVLAMIFEKPSTRTRVSFDVGMRQMGGETLLLSGAELQLGRGESISDTAQVLSRYVDAIMIRTFEQQKLEELAEHATIPVINGLTDTSHPCQVMADVMTLQEKKKDVAGLTVAWWWPSVVRTHRPASGRTVVSILLSAPRASAGDRARSRRTGSRGVRRELFRSRQCLVDIFDDVLHVFDADGQADQVRCDAPGQLLVF